MKYGYKASAEQFGPRELLDYCRLAEELGLETIAISDHFQPWRHKGGHAPNVLPWLGAIGERTERALLGTSVLTPTLRYHPSIVAQAFATLACLNPGRVFLGIGTGEAMNETPATGAEFPGAKERRMRMAEAIELMCKLWTEERVDFAGEYYTTERATIYDRPDEPIPIYVAASGSLAAKLAGRVADGLICTSGKKPELYEELTANLEAGAEAAGRDASAIDRRSSPTRKWASRTRSRWRKPPTRSSTAPIRALSSPTIPTRSWRRSPPTSSSGSHTCAFTAPAVTKPACCASSAVKFCRSSTTGSARAPPR